MHFLEYNNVCVLIKISLTFVLKIWINTTISLPGGKLIYLVVSRWSITSNDITVGSYNKSRINTLMPRQDGHRFADDIFKCIFLNENIWILSALVLLPASFQNGTNLLITVLLINNIWLYIGLYMYNHAIMLYMPVCVRWCRMYILSAYSDPGH